MRNLVSLQRRQWPLLPRDADAISSTTDSNINSLHSQSAYTTFALHADEPRGFFLRGDGRIDVATLDGSDVDSTLRQPTELFVDLREFISTPESDDSAVADGGAPQWKWMSYIAELDALACAHASGTLAVVDVATRDVEEIGTMDGGVCGIAWSSNQEMVAVVTGVDTVLVMNTQWEVLHETQLDAFLPSDVMRQQQQPCTEVAVRWRDDAQYLVLNVPVVSTASRAGSAAVPMQKIMVFTSQLEFHALGRLEDGRAIPGLGAALDWSPNQSLIASSEARKDQLFVVFFERNGLRHGEFALPPTFRASAFRVAQLGWNADSDVLAVALESSYEAADADAPRESVLQLWARDNYHWFLKQERRLHAECKHLVRFAWDAERAHVLHMLTHSSSNARSGAAQLLQEEFVWDVSRAERSAVNARSGAVTSVVVTGVIDGATLLLTPLHQALVPPPLALHQLAFAAPINSVVFDSESEVLAALLATGDVVIVEQYLSSAAVTTLVHRHQPLGVDGGDDDGGKEALRRGLSSLQWMRLWRDSNECKALSLVAKSCWDDALVVASVALLSGDATLSVQYPPALEGVRRATQVVGHGRDGHHEQQQLRELDAIDTQSSSVAIQTHDGTVYTISPTSPIDSDSDGDECVATELTDRCPAFAQLAVLATSLSSSSDPDVPATHIVLGLQTSAKLYVDGTLLAPACSTFRYCPTAHVLLFTTLGSDAQLRMLPLDALARRCFDVVEARTIERGAKLVAVVGDRAHVVVQLPRGNLECMAPRLLVLALSVQLIAQRAYVAALEMCRKHRLDLNLLVDYDVHAFLAHMPQQLVRAYVRTRPAAITSDRLCLLLTSLHGVDVWRTKYKPQVTPFLTAAQSETSEPADSNDVGDDRVNVVCQAVMRAIRDVEASELDADANSASALLLPFVTAAVKQSPPQYTDALGKVHSLLRAGDASAATRALKHLILLTDVNVLFDEALGLYDLALVRFVAMYSQRDPKEYAPLLEELARIAAADATAPQNASSADLFKFTVDLHLQRYARALVHVCALVRSAPDTAAARTYEDAAIDVVTRGVLYDQALALFSSEASSSVTAPATVADVKALRTRVALLKGEYLEATQQHEAAAYVYLSEAALERAQRAFLAAGQWEMGLSLALQTQQSPSDVQRFAYSVAQTLLQRLADGGGGASSSNSNSSVVLAVARIYVEYCSDIDEAVALLVSHREYTEALRLARLHGRADLVESDVESGVLQASRDVTDEIAASAAAYERHWTRLTALREQKRLFKLHGIDGSRWQRDGDGDDAQSVVSGAPSAADSALSSASMRSVGSHNSAVSIGNFALQTLAHATSSHFYATSSAAAVTAGTQAPKKVRLSRNERRNKIKKGSAEEERFVWQQCVASAPSAALQQHVQRLLQMLVLFGHAQRAQKLQTALFVFERLVREDKPLPAQQVGVSAAAESAPAVPSVAWRLAALHGE